MNVLLVIPAQAGTNFDFGFTATAKIKMDPSLRWNDGDNPGVHA